MKTFEVKVTPQAEDDLSDIWCGIALDSVANADAFLDALHLKISDLSLFPFAYEAVPVLGKGIRRRVLHANFVAYYEVHHDEVHILRVKPSPRSDAEFFG